MVNPHATRVRAGMTEMVAAALGSAGPVEILHTREPGDGAVQTRRALERGATLVATLGGDGTVADAAGVLAGGPVPLAPLPGGSTNVFARAIGWPRGAEAAAQALAGLLAAGAGAREVQLGAVTTGGATRVCCVNAGVGVDAEAVTLVEEHPDAKRRLRQGAFAGAVAVSAVRGAIRPPRLLVRVDDGEPMAVAALSLAWGRPYAYLGDRPLDLVPGADFDGTIAWVGTRPRRPGAAAVGIAGALTGAWHVRRGVILHGAGARRVELRADRPVALQADGEPLGRHAAASFACGPPLRVLTPGLKSG